MKIALDTNLLAYAEGVNDAAKRDMILDIVARLPLGSAVIPVQVLGELFNVLVRKAGRSPDAARESILAWTDAFGVVPTGPEVMTAAVDIATDHRLSIWDAVILSASAQAGCRLLLSEDLQDGFTWGGLTIANPFSPEPHPALVSLIGRTAE